MKILNLYAEGFIRFLPIISFFSFQKEFNVILLNLYLNYTLNILKKHINYQFKMLSCISGVDLLNKKYRFCIVYEILSFVNNTRLRLKAFTNEANPSFSILDVFISAGWWEREIWDLFGIYFIKHKDLRRLLTDYGNENHPLRKDYPLSGYIELRYNEYKKRVVSESIQLTQTFRNFYFEETW